MEGTGSEPKEPDVAAARRSTASLRLVATWITGSLLLGTTTMLLALLAGSSLLRLVLIAGIGLAALLTVFIFRMATGGARPGRRLEKVRVAALLPAIAASLVFITYAVAIVLVHRHTVSVQRDDYSHAVQRYAKATRVANRADRQLTTAVGPALHAILEGWRLSKVQESIFTRRLASVRKQFSTDLRKHRRLAAARLLVQAYPISRARKAAAIRAVRRDLAAQRHAAQTQAAYRRSIPGKTPAADALPAWFSQLGRFFQLSAQLLAALTVAIIFTRRGRWEGLAERHLAVAMTFAFIGIVAGLVGSLPEIHRGLQALLLGYIVAGFAGVLSGLATTSIAQQQN